MKYLRRSFFLCSDSFGGQILQDLDRSFDGPSHSGSFWKPLFDKRQPKRSCWCKGTHSLPIERSRSSQHGTFSLRSGTFCGRSRFRRLFWIQPPSETADSKSFDVAWVTIKKPLQLLPIEACSATRSGTQAEPELVHAHLDDFVRFLLWWMAVQLLKSRVLTAFLWPISLT